MSTKINTLKQLRKGDNGTFLGNKDNELKWLTIADLGVKDAAAITEEINNAIEAAKTQLKIDINTAKFVGPVASEAGQEDSIDANDLLLVGDAAPYKIFAKVGGALVELGKTDVDLTNYYTKQEVDQKVEAAKNEAAQDATTKAEQAKQEAVALAAQDATTKANEAKREAVEEAGRLATGEAELVKNELNPRITALEERPVLRPDFNIYTTKISGDQLSQLAFGASKPKGSFGERQSFLFVNGVKQIHGVDFTFGGYTPGTGRIVVNFTAFPLDAEDVVELVVHEFTS